jgi:hypothetical protein
MLSFSPYPTKFKPFFELAPFQKTLSMDCWHVYRKSVFVIDGKNRRQRRRKHKKRRRSEKYVEMKDQKRYCFALSRSAVEVQ